MFFHHVVEKIIHPSILFLTYNAYDARIDMCAKRKNMTKTQVRKQSGLWKAWLFWSMGGFFYFYEMILRASSGVLANDLMASFSITPQELGFLSSMYYWAYTPLQIPCGLILDKIGSRKLITISCLLCAFGAGLFAWTTSLHIACVARFFMGAGSACAFISTLALCSDWFPSSYFGLIAGLTNLLGCVGGVFAGEPLAALSAQMGWRNAMTYLSWFGFALALLIWACLRDKNKAGAVIHVVHMWPRLKRLMRRPQIWLIAIVGGLLYLPISAFAELWAIPFLQASYGLDEKTASYAQMSLYLMSGVGGPLLAALAQRWKSYLKVLKMVAIVECVLFALISMTSFFSYKVVIAIASFIGLFLGGQVLVFSVVKFQCSKDELGSAHAFTNAVVMAFGMIFQPLLGKILQAAWAISGGRYVDGVPVYTGGMYFSLIGALVAAFLVSCALLYWTKDTYVNDDTAEQ